METLVGMALISVIAALSASYFRQVSLDENEARARDMVDREANMWILSVERDLAYRQLPKGNDPFPAICNGLCREFIIHPLARKQVGTGIDDYRVQYYTYCQGTPEAIKSKYGSQFDFSAGGLSAKLGSGHLNRCMKMINCPSGTYPQIVRTIDNSKGVKVPSYPAGSVGYDGAYRSVLPQLGVMPKTADQVVAAAACTDTSPNNSDRIMFEMAYLSQDNQVRIRRKEISVPRRNLSRAQLIPNE